MKVLKIQQIAIINKPSKSYLMSITSSTIGKKTYKIVLLGDSSTGKTSIIERFVNNKFEEKDNPTIGIDFIGKNVSHNQISCRLQLWDTAGQERYRSLIPSYLKDAICAIFVFDNARQQTLQNLESWIQLFRQNRGQKTVMIACANKTDLQQSYDKNILTPLLQKYKMMFQQVSAKQGTNIDAMFHQILEQIISMQIKKRKKIEDETDLIPPPTTENLTSARTNRDPIQIENEEPQNKRKWLCC